MSFFNISLSKLLKKKDSTAFEELLGQYSNKVYRLAMTLLKNRQDVEDIVQEVFLTVFSKIDNLKEDKALSSWIYRITVNASMMRLRKSKNLIEVSFEENSSRFDQTGSYLGKIADWSKTPEEEICSKEMMNYLKKSLEKLPAHDKVVFQLRDIEGLHNQEVADILSISLSAVKSRLHRARLFLRDSITDYIGEEGPS